MSHNANNKSKNTKSEFQHLNLQQMALLSLALFLMLFSFAETAHAQQNRAIKQDLFSVSFSTEQQGWACGRWGSVLHTDDGGKNWDLQDSSTDYALSSICFSDPQNGWAVGENGTIIHTGDGGRCWERQKCPVDYFLMGVCFVTDRKGWAVSEWTTILYTEDGGENWQVQFTGEDYCLNSVSFCDPQNGWAAGEYGYIYHTSDGGRTWEHQAGAFAFSEEAFELVGENTLFDVYAVDPNRAWAVGIDGHITRTLDGGTTWEKVESGVKMAQLFGICSDSQGSTILIGGKGLLITSSDAGKRFSVPEITPPVTYGWLYRIAPRGSNGFVAVGKDGWIYLSDKKGISWHRSSAGM